MANLYDVLVALWQKQQRTAVKSGGGDALYQPGTVLGINGDGTYSVSVAGQIMTANPETDLPLRVGQPVYVSQVRNGRPVVHGPR